MLDLRTGRQKGNTKGVDETHLSLVKKELDENRDRRLLEIMENVYSCTQVGLGWYYKNQHWKGKLFANRCRQNITQKLPQLTKAAWEFSEVLIKTHDNCKIWLEVMGYGEKLVGFSSNLRF